MQFIQAWPAFYTFLSLPYKISIKCNDNYQNFLSFSFHLLLKSQPGTFNARDCLNSIAAYLDLNWFSIFHSCWCINYFRPRLGNINWCYNTDTHNPIQPSLGGYTPTIDGHPSHLINTDNVLLQVFIFNLSFLIIQSSVIFSDCCPPSCAQLSTFLSHIVRAESIKVQQGSSH